MFIRKSDFEQHEEEEDERNVDTIEIVKCGKQLDGCNLQTRQFFSNSKRNNAAAMHKNIHHQFYFASALSGGK